MGKTSDFASLMQHSAESGQDRARRRLKLDEIVEVIVIQVTSEFVYADIGTPKDARIPAAELKDAAGRMRVKVGTRLRAKVVDLRGEGPLLASLALVEDPAETAEQQPEPDKVLKAKVVRHSRGGPIVATNCGEGLVPIRELELPFGSDFRRAVNIGKEFSVVLLRTDERGRSVFSARKVKEVEEHNNYQEYSSRAAEPTTAPRMGNLGDALRKKLGLTAPEAADEPPRPQPKQQPAAPSAKPARETTERPGVVRRFVRNDDR